MRLVGQQRTACVAISLVSFAIAFFGDVAVSRANEPISYAVNARLQVEDGVIVGAMHTEVWVDEGEEELRFWLYPDRNQVPPSAMGEMSGRWIYPGGVSTGGVRISDLRVDGRDASAQLERHPPGSARGRDFAGADLVVPITAGPRRPVSVRLRFEVDLPERYGRVGAVDDRVTLTAPWYPLLVDGDAYRFSVPHRVRVDATESLALLVGGERVSSGEYVERTGAFVPVVAAPELHELVRRVGSRTLRIFSPEPLYTEPSANAEGLAALSDIDRIPVPAMMERSVADVYATLAEARVPHRRGDLVVAMVPSRVELATTAPGLILCSDNIYEIFPLDVTEEFHHRAFRRALFRHLVAPISDATEAPGDRDWVDDFRAVFLVDVDDARRHGVARTPEELVGFAAFHPSVDALLYAPQLQYVETFFGSIDEPDPFRDDPARSRRHVSRGRRVLESARDALHEDDFRELTEALLEGDEAVASILERLDESAADRLEVWLDTPNRRVNYRYGELSSEPHPSGGYVNRVEVFRDGADRPEPVEVLIEDDEGNEQVVVWDGAGPRGVVEAHMPAPIEDVHIDPRHRLSQAPEVADGHPRGDDATSKPFRPPLLTGLGLNLALTEGQVFGYVSFALRRRYDLEESFAFTLSHLSSTTGGNFRYVRGIGPKRHTNARIGAASVGLDFDRVRDDFVGAGVGGYRLSLIGSAGFDTRTYFVDPREGSSAVFSGRVGGVVRDDDEFGVTAGLGFRASHMITMGLRNAMLLVGGVGWTFGDALSGELQQLGGRFLLRGFGTQELVGRGKAYLVAEHRITALSDLRWNLVHLAWLREIQLAVWTGGGMTFDSIPDGGLRLAAEVGGGLRFHYTYGGVQPGVMSIDVGVPLTRNPNAIGSDGRLNSTRSPIGLYVSFSQFF